MNAGYDLTNIFIPVISIGLRSRTHFIMYSSDYSSTVFSVLSLKGPATSDQRPTTPFKGPVKGPVKARDKKIYEKMKNA